MEESGEADPTIMQQLEDSICYEEQFIETYSSFLKSVESRTQIAEKELETLKERILKLMALYGKDPDEVKPTEFFATLRNMGLAFKETVKTFKEKE